MQIKNRHSLLLSLGILMASIALLAISSMAASLFIADTMQGQATAINESGSLRMRSYRIASSLIYDSPDERHYQETLSLINEFEQHLLSTNLTNAIPENDKHPLHIAYHKIEKQWYEEIQPIFDIYLEGISENTESQKSTDSYINMNISEAAVINLRNQYFLVVSDFVDDIDNLVNLLEQNSETRIKQLRLYQFIALALTLLLIFTALVLVYKRVHIPLKQLLFAAECTRKSDFSFRTSYTQDDELGQLGSAFNSMAEDLSHIYKELENRVKQKTLDLERSHDSMELLYKTVRRLNEAESPHDTFPSILKDIEQLLSTGQGVICLSDPTKENAAMLASTLQTRDFRELLCEQHYCKKCLGQCKPQNLNIENSSGETLSYTTFPISEQNNQYGVLIIQSANTKPLQTWQIKLLQSIAGHIGIAIKLSQQAAETRRLSLMEERGSMARELHDSLAQSLTFMKIQVSRLQALLKKPDSKADAENIISELRMGLNSAYKELRELLTTFRLKIDGEDFNEALLKTVAEFNERSSTRIECENKITYYDLTPNEEIHILQLIREALSNIVQHANASQAKLIIQYTDNGLINICINDNGIGISEKKSQAHHYGISIMDERAKALNGILEINNNPQGGVTICLNFLPTNNTAPINIEPIKNIT